MLKIISTVVFNGRTIMWGWTQAVSDS